MRASLKKIREKEKVVWRRTRSFRLVHYWIITGLATTWVGHDLLTTISISFLLPLELEWHEFLMRPTTRKTWTLEISWSANIFSKRNGLLCLFNSGHDERQYFSFQNPHIHLRKTKRKMRFNNFCQKVLGEALLGHANPWAFIYSNPLFFSVRPRVNTKSFLGYISSSRITRFHQDYRVFKRRKSNPRPSFF